MTAATAQVEVTETDTPPGIDPRVWYLRRMLLEQGFDVRMPNNRRAYWVIQDPTGDQFTNIADQSRGVAVFRAMLHQLRVTFGWSEQEVREADLEAQFYRNRERRNRLRSEMPEWDPEFMGELVRRAEEQLAENTMTFTVEIIDEMVAYRYLLRHREAAIARGMGQDLDASLLLFEEGEKFVQQRQVLESHVDDLARAMLRGEWLATHQGMAMSNRGDGLVLDGQHRLWAVVRSGVPCVFTVARGVPDEAFSKMDGQRTRTPQQLLGMLGINNPGGAVAAIRLLHYYDDFTQDRAAWYRNKLSSDQIIHHFLYQYRDIAESVSIGTLTGKAPGRDTPKAHQLSPAALIAAHYLIRRAWPEAPVDEFFDSIRRDYRHEVFVPIHKHSELNFPVRRLNAWSNTWDTRRTTERRGKNDKQIEGLCQILSAFNATMRGEAWTKPQFQERHNTPVPYVPGGDQ